MTRLLRTPSGVEPVAIDCASDSDTHEARTRRSIDNLRELGAPEALIAHHEGILAGIHGENARLHAAIGEDNTMRPNWHDIEAQAEGAAPTAPRVSIDEALNGARGIGWAFALELAFVLVALALFFAIGNVTHDETGRVRAAVEETVSTR